MRGKDLLLPLLTALLLTLSFPRFELHGLAWVSLVPLFLAIGRAPTSKKAFLLSYIAGLFFFLFSIHWLRYVTVFGLLFVCAYQAFYFGLFGLFTQLFLRRDASSGGAGKFSGSVQRGLTFFVIPGLWTFLEFVRSEIPVFGFGWNLLGYSQAGNLPVAQFASVLGAYGVSFLVVLVNTAIFMILRRGRLFRKILLGVLTAGCVAATYGYGMARLKESAEGPVYRIGIVQGNIQQEEKWLLPAKPLIIEKYLKLTEILAFEKPDLIIWPEAAFPGFFNEEFEASGIASLVKKIGCPLLVGSPHRGADESYYNSTYLVTSDGILKARYDKIFLVPFGEYVPFKKFLFFLEPIAYALGVSDFEPGEELTVFELPSSPPLRFSTLVCFEDIFPRLSRGFLLEGAQLLLVVTNDAWFGKTSAPYQHLQASVFRAIENGVTVVRAGNIGVSAFISPYGRVLDRVRNEKGEDTYVTGTLSRPIQVFHLTTFYRSFGYVFPFVCLLLVLVKIRYRTPFRNMESVRADF